MYDVCFFACALIKCVEYCIYGDELPFIQIEQTNTCFNEAPGNQEVLT
jgi:hypothetical protein